MSHSTAEAREAAERVDTVHWVAHAAMLSMQRYRLILGERSQFQAVFPGVNFENPRITHTVEEHGVLFSTSKRELLQPHNYDLYKAWQIVLAISGMTSVLEWYLHHVAEQVTNTAQNSMGMFSRFSRITGVRISNFDRFARLRHYYELRNISLHNFGRVNKKFKDRTEEQHHDEGSYVFYPHQVNEYRSVLLDFFAFVESCLAT